MCKLRFRLPFEAEERRASAKQKGISVHIVGKRSYYDYAGGAHTRHYKSDAQCAVLRQLIMLVLHIGWLVGGFLRMHVLFHNETPS